MYDVIIIGAGPAGLSAALYLRRSNRSVLLLEGEGIGGQIAKSPRLENYPAIETVSGMEWADRVFNQVDGLGVNFDFGRVTSIEKLSEGHFKVDYGTVAEGKAVIVAAGCHHRNLGLAKEESFVGHGLSYCATCDGAFYKDQKVLVVGDGNSAVQYAITLANLCKKVVVCTLFDDFRADPIIVKNLLGLANVEIRHNLESKELLGEKEMTGVRFLNKETNQDETIAADGLFVAIGQIPNNEPFLPLVELENGFIVVNEDMQTKTDGLFAAGDCRVKKTRQVVTAVSDGAIAAVSADKYLNSLQS